ncbi:DUF6249 domain-containing protein [Nitratireductor sp. XY-223]|uniref:DUF6249 domain-containing protein n=1 Tax=Nitratireductor sp. XY-223 TaxID=2561926 RepID=UPI0010AA0ECB|nr:DUF6249 domain-containing protein [Nitratireductor sp. XY-223]
MQGMGLDGLGAGLAAFGFWMFVAAVVVAGIWYDIAKRRAQHETLRRLIESGQTIDPELLDKLFSATTGGGERLQRELMIYGVVTLFVAPGIALLAWFLSLQYPPALYPVLGAAVLVGFVAIGLIVASRAAGRSSAGGTSGPAGRLGR